ncbi:MAG: SCP2 sterol-binding domain-containing protein [Myxococcales bacterium]|nr:SCP2 sterol-binding domain-containing protein [Myxococcales bacterium]
MSTCEEYFAKLNERFVAEAAKDVNAVYQYNLTGEGGGDWWVKFENGQMTVEKGVHEKPNVTYTMDAKHYVDMANGDLDGTKAYLTRKLKVKGNLALAQKLKKILPPSK